LKGTLKQRIKDEWGTANETEREELKKPAKRIRENESEILKQQAEDRALFLMASELMGEPLTIEDIQQIGFNIRTANVLDRNRAFSIRMYGKKVTARLPIKRYGEFRRFMKDRRLENLMKYYTEEEIPLGVISSGQEIAKGEKYTKSNLLEEMELYDRERIELAKVVYVFEKLIFTHYPDLLSEAFKMDKPSLDIHTHYVDHYYYLEVADRQFSQQMNLHSASLKNFNEFRKRLHHNEIPYDEWIKKNIEFDTSTPMITRRIINLAIDLYQHINNVIEKEHELHQ
jgi:hypothetical protein